MVSVDKNPALAALIQRIAPELVFAQVLIQRTGEGFELRHGDDRAATDLRLVSPDELRALVQFTATGAFRPLKSAPTLKRGWRCVASNPEQLVSALRHLYPGAVADWFAAQQPNPPVTHYRTYSGRQTGMYRITAMLTDQQVAEVARAGCHARFCLKQRLWTVDGQPPDRREDKSLIPCLEPCAVLMEFARAVMRIEQKGGVLPSAEAAESCGEMREADFSNPANPRFEQLRLERNKANGGN